MKNFLLVCASIVFTTALTAPLALAADSPWLGTWKLDPAKSHFTGETFAYSKLPNGMMHYTDGSTTSYDFGIDGKEYATVSGRSTAWTAAGDNAWDSVAKYKGTLLSKTHRVLSGDGKTLTIHSTGTQPDGKTFTTNLPGRVSAGPQALKANGSRPRSPSPFRTPTPSPPRETRCVGTSPAIRRAWKVRPTAQICPSQAQPFLPASPSPIR